MRKGDFFSFAFLTLLIRGLLDYLFINYVTENWAYYGFILDINISKVILSYVFLILFILLLNFYRENVISHFLVIILFFTVYVPIGVIYSLMNKSPVFFIIATISFLILCVITIFFNVKTKENYEQEIFLKKPVYYCVNIISCITVLLMTIQNIRNMDILQVLNLRDVYSIRENVTYHWGMNYFFSWQTKVITPLMIILTHKNKMKYMHYIFIASQVWLFLLTGQKMVLFTLVIALLLMKFSYKLTKPNYIFIRGMAILLIISFLEVVFLKNSYIIDFFIRRIMYLPALLNFYYYEFFSQHNFQFWKYSFIGRFLDLNTDFELEPSFVIGNYFFGNDKTNAVTGYLGSEYMNGGIFGVLVATIVLIIIFKILDKYSIKFGKEVVLVTLVAPLYTLWNSALLTSLLTGGIIIALILFSQIRTKQNEKKYS